MRINPVLPQAVAFASGDAAKPVQPALPAAPVDKAAARHHARGAGGMAPPGSLNGPSVNTLVVIGAVEDEPRRRHRQAEGLFQGIDLLEELHRELASGSVSPARLDQMGAWLATAELPAQPRLADMMHDIRLRLAVELAKLGR
jgi:hypothetical protein